MKTNKELLEIALQKLQELRELEIITARSNASQKKFKEIEQKVIAQSNRVKELEIEVAKEQEANNPFRDAPRLERSVTFDIDGALQNSNQRVANTSSKIFREAPSIFNKTFAQLNSQGTDGRPLQENTSLSRALPKMPNKVENFINPAYLTRPTPNLLDSLKNITAQQIEPNGRILKRKFQNSPALTEEQEKNIEQFVLGEIQELSGLNPNDQILRLKAIKKQIEDSRPEGTRKFIGGSNPIQPQVLETQVHKKAIDSINNNIERIKRDPNLSKDDVQKIENVLAKPTELKNPPRAEGGNPHTLAEVVGYNKYLKNETEQQPYQYDQEFKPLFASLNPEIEEKFRKNLKDYIDKNSQSAPVYSSENKINKLRDPLNKLEDFTIDKFREGYNAEADRGMQKLFDLYEKHINNKNIEMAMTPGQGILQRGTTFKNISDKTREKALKSAYDLEYDRYKDRRGELQDFQNRNLDLGKLDLDEAKKEHTSKIEAQDKAIERQKEKTNVFDRFGQRVRGEKLDEMAAEQQNELLKKQLKTHDDFNAVALVGNRAPEFVKFDKIRAPNNNWEKAAIIGNLAGQGAKAYNAGHNWQEDFDNAVNAKVASLKKGKKSGGIVKKNTGGLLTGKDYLASVLEALKKNNNSKEEFGKNFSDPDEIELALTGAAITRGLGLKAMGPGHGNIATALGEMAPKAKELRLEQEKNRQALAAESQKTAISLLKSIGLEAGKEQRHKENVEWKSAELKEKNRRFNVLDDIRRLTAQSLFDTRKEKEDMAREKQKTAKEEKEYALFQSSIKKITEDEEKIKQAYNHLRHAGQNQIDLIKSKKIDPSHWSLRYSKALIPKSFGEGIHHIVGSLFGAGDAPDLASYEQNTNAVAAPLSQITSGKAATNQGQAIALKSKNQLGGARPEQQIKTAQNFIDLVDEDEKSRKKFVLNRAAPFLNNPLVRNYIIANYGGFEKPEGVTIDEALETNQRNPNIPVNPNTNGVLDKPPQGLEEKKKYFFQR